MIAAPFSWFLLCTIPCAEHWAATRMILQCAMCMFDAADALSVPDMFVVRRTACECNHAQLCLVKVGSGGSHDPPDAYSSATAPRTERFVNIFRRKTSENKNVSASAVARARGCGACLNRPIFGRFEARAFGRRPTAGFVVLPTRSRA